jgi:hypothetical protein
MNKNNIDLQELISIRDQMIAYSVLVGVINKGGLRGLSELGETIAEKLSAFINELEQAD